MNLWDRETGVWKKPKDIWAVDQGIPQDAPECWLSKPGGEYFAGISFHMSPFSFPEGEGCIGSNMAFHPSDFLLGRIHDPYNSWGVTAIRKSSAALGCMEHWDWLPGITVYDKSTKYTLPSNKLAAFAGTEWADNDIRVYHGFYSDEAKNCLLSNFLKVINRITGPRFSGWPFGYRQLTDAVFVWIHSESNEVNSMLLVSPRQFGDKYSYFNRNLYDPGSTLGAWDKKPDSWDCRQVLKYLYKARLLLHDGFHEIALVAASSAVEKTFYEIVFYLENGDAQKAKRLVKQHTFRNRASKLLAGYGFVLPQSHFDKLKEAYKARNSIAHELSSFSHEAALEYISYLEAVIEWYYKNVT